MDTSYPTSNTRIITSEEMHLPVYSVNVSIFDMKLSSKAFKIKIYPILF
tara:strand:- start:418 stop:564 length:147 start_codon:yes stop_codon:yes gene_type:complete